MIYWLIKSTLCSGLLLMVYHLLLQRTTLYRFNRFYLLLSMPFSLLVPLISISWTQTGTVTQVKEYLQDQVPVVIGQQGLVTVPVVRTSVPAAPADPVNWFLWMYIAVTAVFLFLFLKTLFQLCRQVRNNPTVRHNGATLVLLPEKYGPYTFLRYIFLSRQEYEAKTIEPEILLHEQTHARELHSMDILLIEAIRVFSWFNPFVFFYRGAMQLNHEFLSDAAVTGGSDVQHYQRLILARINSITRVPIANQFNYLSTKKRLIMMTRTTSPKMARLTRLAIALLFPAAFLLFCNFSYQVARLPDGKVDSAVPGTSSRMTMPLTWIKAGSMPKSYQMGSVINAADNREIATIKSIEARIKGFGTYMRMHSPGKFAGKRVRFSAMVKTSNVSNWSGLWMRLDGKDSNECLGFDNMHDGYRDRSIKGTTGWTRYEIVLNVPSNTSFIAYGVLLGGTGQVWFDKARLEEVNNATPVTGRNRPVPIKAKPGRAISTVPFPLRTARKF